MNLRECLRKWAVYLTYCLITVSSSAFATGENNAKTNITFSYWNQATPPFAIEESGELINGIIKDIGDAISKELNVKPNYLKLPVARDQAFLRSGKVDATCITSPIWKESPDDFYWSPILFKGADRFLIRNDPNKEIKSFEDLKGLRMAIYHGYVYHPEIMKMIKNKDVDTLKVTDINQGIKLLKLGRIDTLIDFGVLIRYQILKQDLKDTLKLASAHADDFDLHCAYSKKSDFKPEQLNMAIETLLKDGAIERILAKYR